MSPGALTDPTELAEPWNAWRERRAPTHVIHLDAAAAGRPSFDVQRAIAHHLRRESEAGAYIAEAEAATLIDLGRRQLGVLVGVPAAGIAFVESATAALNALLAAWPLPPQATIAVAPSEWGSNLRAMRMHDMRIRLLDADPEGLIDLASLRDLVTSNPPSIVHVTASAAHRRLVQPAEAIVTICHERGVPVWLDAAQALGQIDAASAADAVYATSRKWLCGPRGVGVLGIAEPWWDQLAVEPMVLNPSAPPVARLESDEANVAGRVGLCIAVQEYLDNDPEAIHQRLTQVADTARDILQEVGGWHLVPSATDAGAITALSPSHGQDVVVERGRLLEQHRILVTASQPQRAPHDQVGPTLRISPHVDTTRAQLRALAAVLAEPMNG